MEYLTKPELRRFFTVAFAKNRKHHLALLTGFWHGLRISETLEIEGKDICADQLSVQRKKGSNKTLQPLHYDADPVFDCRPLATMAAQTPGKLFLVTRQRLDQFIKECGAAAGIHPSKLHSHAVGKHSIAMQLWDSSQSLGIIQNYLGHVSPGSTLAYLREVDSSKAQAAVAQMVL